MKKFDFSKGFGNIDPKYISEAEKGLTSAEVAARLAQDGHNTLSAKQKSRLGAIILEQTGGCLCDPGFDFNGFIESESTGCD